MELEQAAKSVTPKENLFRTLSGGRPEWMPVCVHIANANNLPGFLPKTLLKQPLDRLKISQFVGGDILYEIYGIQTRLADGFGIEQQDQGNTRHSTLVTPQGNLTQDRLFSRTPSPSYNDIPPDYTLPGPIVTSARTRYFVQRPQDYDILRAYYGAQTFHTNHNLIASELRRVGQAGTVVLGGGPPSPLYALISAYAGIERVVYDLVDVPDQVESTIETIKDVACQWYTEAARTDCDLIRCTEDLDTKLVSPRLFRQYAVPALREYARICHAHGKLFVIHMCGHIRDILPDIRDIGADAIHCLTTPPTGNTTPAQARQILAGHTAAMIRIDPSLLLHGSHDQIDHFVAGVCKSVADWRNVLIIIPCGRASLWSVRRVIDQVQKRGN